MTQGALIYAFNNERINYCKIAVEAARRAILFLQKPVSIVTDAKNNVEKIAQESGVALDQIIVVADQQDPAHKGLRRYNDGTLKQDRLEFKNQARTKTYEVTPYDETLVIDCDYFVSNDNLKNCFDQDKNFLIWQKGIDLSGYRDPFEFDRLSNFSIDFYWATVFFFKKCNETKIFFDLVDHVRDNWDYYKFVYRFDTPVFRNDHAFSIALHIINGFKKSKWHGELPGRLLYTIDKDLLVEMSDSSFTFLIEKEKAQGQYTLMKTSNVNVHIMNKFSIGRLLDA